MTYLDIGNQGSYKFSGGTLQINNGGLANQGVFDATQSTGLLTVTRTRFSTSPRPPSSTPVPCR